MTDNKDQAATAFALNIRRPYKKVLEEAIAMDKLNAEYSLTTYEKDMPDYRPEYENTYTRKLITIHTGEHREEESDITKEYLTLQITPDEALFKLDNCFVYIEDGNDSLNHKGSSKEIAMITGNFSIDSLKELRDFLNYALPPKS